MKLSLDPDEWSPRRTGTPKPLPTALTYGDQTVARLLRAKIGERQDVLSRIIMGGTLSTMEDYRSAVGEMKGLVHALKVLTEAERELSGEGTAQQKDTPLYES